MTFARCGLAAAAGLAAILASRGAAAHCMIGPRMIPMTLAIDTPCVMDDFMPMAMGTRNGDHTRELDVPLMLSKRITKDFGVTLAGTWTRMWMPENLSYMAMIMDHHMTPDGAMMMMPMLMPMGMYMPGMTMGGWQNLQTTFKYQLLTDKKSELVVSAGLFVDWGGVGNRSAGAPRFTTLVPSLWIGKGFGDLPEEFGWTRAFAATGQFGLRLPTWRRTLAYSLSGMSPAGADMSGMLNSVMDMSCMNMPAPYTFDMTMAMPSIDECRHSPTFAYGASLQYSFSYLKKTLKVDLGVPDFVYELNPIVEVQFRTPLSGVRTTSLPPYYGVELTPNNQRVFATSPTSASTVGTVNPGLIWMGDKIQIGAEAIIPINRQSGRAVGWMASIDFSLQRLFPDTLGKPLIQMAGDEEEDHDHDHDGHEGHDHEGHDHEDHDHQGHDHGAHAHGAGHGGHSHGGHGHGGGAKGAGGHHDHSSHAAHRGTSATATGTESSGHLHTH
ncbi:hypothetical protein [Methylosinus sp. LW4]|uniref:hypothetical protein n=1 Tax=Methylosinus sp. LW4 TaxID=136993 RepID=UPI00035D204C|nr:hypothetical protein [Methylosinus sp. LW4]